MDVLKALPGHMLPRATATAIGSCHASQLVLNNCREPAHQKQENAVPLVKFGFRPGISTWVQGQNTFHMGAAFGLLRLVRRALVLSLEIRSRTRGLLSGT